MVEITKVVKCESGGKQYEEDGKYVTGLAGEIGIGQFMPSTWAKWNLERQNAGLKQLNIGDREDQLEMMQWAWKMGYQEHWSCYKQLFPRHGG